MSIEGFAGKGLGNRIRVIRKQLGLSMEEFGNLVDKAGKSTVSKWEKGLNIPNNARLKKIADLGNSTVEELLKESTLTYIGTYLKDLRKANGLSLIELSALSGVSQPFISQLENNKRKPSPDILRNLSVALNVPYVELMEVAGYLESDEQNDASRDIKTLLKYSKLTYEGIEMTQEQRNKILKIIDIVLE